MLNTKLETLNLLDKFLFDEAMEDRETCQAVIGILLENEVELLGKAETEKELRVSPELRQIHERVCRIRKSEKAGVRYLQRWEELAYAREDGKTEGDLRRVVSLVCKKLKKNKTVEEIAEDLEEEISVIEPFYNAAKESAPGYDPELVFRRINAGKTPE